jgi:hypothetical protein
MRSAGPDVTESCEILAQLSEEFGGFTLVIDALDECSHPTKLLGALRESLETINATKGNIKMICSS